MKFLYSCFISFLFIPGVAQQAVRNYNDTTGTIIRFESDTFNFGSVEINTMVEHDFVFTNAGKYPLVISNACGSGGSTVASFSREPIMPGKKGTVHFRFDTQACLSYQDKFVTVDYNAANGKNVIIRMRGNVIPPKNSKIEFDPQTAPAKFRAYFDSAHCGKIMLDTFREYICISFNNGNAVCTVMEKYDERPDPIFIDLYDSHKNYHEFYDSKFMLYRSRKFLRTKPQGHTMYHDTYYRIRYYKNGKCYKRSIYIHKGGGF
jgi:hypothetical protein